MCGYIGKISSKPTDNLTIEDNNKRIICRGPDETIKLKNQFFNLFNNNDELYFNFIFNRLAIVDLGQNSSQPMVNKEKNTVLMFNGEIFNHVSLRKELERDGIKFYSDHSDSEVVLNGLTYYGVSFVERMIGQFSIMFYESIPKKIILVRDRLGQKPLFYGNDKSEVVFGSNLISVSKELKRNEINKESYEDFVNYGVVPSPNTIFKDVFKVNPGEIVSFEYKIDGISIHKEKYWDPKTFINERKFDENKFHEMLTDAITIREQADVPLANFLSGGIDSTLIIKNMHERKKNINSFSVVLQDKKYDERVWSQKVVKEYSTNHTEQEISLQDFESYLNNSMDCFDEPYADPSTVPSYVISKQMSDNYKAAISGDGGDELLSGYTRTQSLLKNKNLFNHIIKYGNTIYPNFLGTGNKFLKNSKFLEEATASYFSDKNLLKFFKINDNLTFENSYFQKLESPFKTLLTTEYSFYLSEMMMLKVDRTSMANSLEVRSPFVDHRLVEYILSSKPEYFDLENPKKLFKNYLVEDFDSEFLHRPKQGFVFNVEDWIYSNKKVIINTILDNNIFGYFSYKKLNTLFQFKSRINGLRLWKIFIISKYIESNT